jgi:Mg-chelatase subunit ChlD
MSKKALKTVVALVLDETGSMAPTVTDTIGAVNDYFKTLAKDAPSALVSVMEFSDCFGNEPTFRVLATAAKVKDVPALTTENYRPRGNTPLYDAIGKAITETETVKADRYLLVVMTDGEENASKEWRLDGIKKLIEKKQGENWTIVYLGANQDAWAVAGAMGVSRGSTMSYAQTSRGVRQTTSSLAGATASLMNTSAATTPDFFASAGQSEKDYQEPDKDEPSLWVKP